MPATLGVKGGHEDGPPHFIDDDDPKRTRTVTDRAIQFMRDQTRVEKPFYVQISYYAQHLSVVCKQQTLAKYQAKGVPDRGYTQAWAAMMEQLDDGVGNLLDAISELGIEGTTYVFFTADNGGRGTIPGGDPNRTATNHPLTGAKHSLYEGGIRVPFLARGPGIAADVREVRVADDRHAAQFVVFAAWDLVLHLDRHIADIGTDSRIVKASGILPGDV
jgi:arylsulfatase A-like enzyme